jgi:Tfp pilus assembly protein FimT
MIKHISGIKLLPIITAILILFTSGCSSEVTDGPVEIVFPNAPSLSPSDDQLSPPDTNINDNTDGGNYDTSFDEQQPTPSAPDIISTPAPSPQEPVIQSTVLSFGSTFSGTITATDDTNHYSITLTQAGRLSVNVTNASTGGFSSPGQYSSTNVVLVRWYSTDGIRVADHSVRGNSFFPYNRSVDLEAGTYYIYIVKQGSYTGSYNIKVDFVAAENNEIELNNDRSSAQLVTAGQTVRGFISHQDDNDMYRLDLTQAGRLTVNITNHSPVGFSSPGQYSSTNVLSVHWYSADGTRIADHSVRGNSFFPYNRSIDLEAGMYYIDIVKQNNYTGAYNFKADFVAAENNEVEPNNDRSNAQLVTSGQTVRGFISYQDDNDMYRLDLSQAGRLTANVTNHSPVGFSSPGQYSSTNVLSVHWYSADGTRIADHSVRGNSFFPYNRSMDLEAGTYYINIVKQNNYTGAYNFKADFVAAENNEIEPNNDRASAQLISSGQTVRGFISFQDDNDMYRINLSQAGSLTVNLTNHSPLGFSSPGQYSSTNVLSVHWYSTDGTRIADHSVRGNSFFPYNRSMDLEAGTYYINIVKQNNYTGAYNITVSVQ